MLVLVTTMASAPAAHSEILIATAGPFTGINLFRGEQIQHGAELAVENINARGGILGQRLTLAIVDDACDPDQSVAVAHKLVGDGAVFVAGHVCSHSSIPAGRIYEDAGVIMISPASTNPRLTDEGGFNVFRVCGRDDHQGVVAGNYLADEWSGGRIAILHDGSTYGRGLAFETKKQLRKRGAGPTLEAEFEPGSRDYSNLIGRMQYAGIDVIYVGAYAADTGLMVRQARDRGYDAQFVTGDALTNEEFWLITGKAGAGTRGTFGPDPRRLAAASAVVNQFRGKGFEPSGYTLHTYAAIQAWAQAVTRAGSVEAAPVSRALKQGKFDTVLGKIGFDEKGDVTAPGFIWYVWKGGEYIPVPES